MAWFKRAARDKRYGDAGASGPNLGDDLKLQRLSRAVRDFPGRTETDLARIIYGHDDPTLVADEARKLEAIGMVSRNPATGALSSNRS